MGQTLSGRPPETTTAVGGLPREGVIREPSQAPALRTEFWLSALNTSLRQPVPDGQVRGLCLEPSTEVVLARKSCSKAAVLPSCHRPTGRESGEAGGETVQRGGSLLRVKRLRPKSAAHLGLPPGTRTLAPVGSPASPHQSGAALGLRGDGSEGDLTTCNKDPPQLAPNACE